MPTGPSPLPPEEEAQRDGTPVVVLRHPSGSKVYLVGVAHVSAKAQQDVLSTIQRVSPAVVLVELDKERYEKLLAAADSGDKYGLDRVKSVGLWKIAKMSLSGDILGYGMSLVYVMTGAVMGTRPGGEFLAAHTAAEEVGAHVVLGDRDQNVTMQRLRYYTHYLTRQDSRREEDMRRMRRMMQGRQPGPEGETASNGGLVIDEGDIRMPGETPDFLRRGPPSPTEKERQVEAEVEASMKPDDPWGLGSQEGTDQGAKRRLLEFMREGGCDKPETVLQAAMRMLRDGMDTSGRISTQDLLTVRDCGTKVVENFRDRAIKGDDAWMQRLELEGVSGAKGAAGMERSATALKKVVVDERDLILARRLWESGLEAAGQPVVGVVGAGHIRGIQKLWTYAGTPAAEQKCKEYLKAPQEQDYGLTAVATGAVIAAVAYRRPRAAAFMVGAVTLAAAPYIGFMMVSMNRFGKLADKLVDAASRADSLAQEETSGWPAGGPADWQ